MNCVIAGSGPSGRLIAPLENMLVVPGGASVGDMASCRRDLALDCYRGAPTYSCCCNAGSLWDATDRVPIVGTFLLAARVSRIEFDCSARATGAGRYCELRRTPVCFVARGSRGHLERQRWRRVYTSLDSRDAKLRIAPTAFQTKTLRCYDGASGTAVWNNELGNAASALHSVVRRSR